MAEEVDSNHTLLKADEVDTDGRLVPKPPPDSQPSRVPANAGTLDSVTFQLTEASTPKKPPVLAAPTRPSLKREVSIPAPQQLPPPAPPRGAESTLPQVPNFASQFPPGVEPAPYAFEYKDYSSMDNEIEDFFSYSEEEQSRLLKAQLAFEQLWRVVGHDDTRWLGASTESQQLFLRGLGMGLVAHDLQKRCDSMMSLLYLLLGCWNETAKATDLGSRGETGSTLEESKKSLPTDDTQLVWIIRNAKLVVDTIGLSEIFAAIRAACSDGPTAPAAASPVEDRYHRPDTAQFAAWAGKIVLYIILETAIRNAENGDSTLRGKFLDLEPGLLLTLTDWLAVLRWDDSASVPSSKLLLLFWKAIILTFGGIAKFDAIKQALGANNNTSQQHHDQPLISASPLDYHIFRQEIISKYPAFDPPQPVFPFEPEHNSILPSLQEDRTEDDIDRFQADGLNITSGIGTSIIHEPVHIATPAPSPPPSPAAPGGKGVKKQNYQTNQNFPFLYPPLDVTSNEIGGKGTTAIQDLLVGRKWAGSDVPTSILEAANLFAQRMRATRAMKQLWEERIRFLKYERGNRSSGLPKEDLEDESGKTSTPAIPEDFAQRLQAVEAFYNTLLPNLQSLVVVLLKVLLQTVTAFAIQPHTTNVTNNSPHNPSSQELEIQGRPASRANSGTAPTSNSTNSALAPLPAPKAAEMSHQDFDRLRTQEIMVKAVSGILLLLLKWFKISHILKFEYFSQLLFDSNYLTFTLKLLAHQELERAVNIKREKKEYNFFQWCKSLSQPPKTPANSSTKSVEESQNELQFAVESPADVVNARDESVPVTGFTRALLVPPPPPPPPPAVDELGIPISYIPSQPITNYSFTAFLTVINTLRIIQKIIKSKPHRQLAMVQLKYSNTLRKVLKVPQSDVRLYALRVIKGQVPYCHRKWRQSNMRVITAIYLRCRPSLRDEWLAGCDVDQEVGEALPQERALRALTYWYNVRRYPEKMSMPPLQSRKEDTLLKNGLDTPAEKDISNTIEPMLQSEKGQADAEDEGKEQDLELDVDLEDYDIDMEEDDVEKVMHESLQEEPDFFLQELEKMDLGEAAFDIYGEGDEHLEQERSRDSVAVEGW